MVQLGKRVSMLMFVLSLVGGIIGFIVGEIIISKLIYVLPESLLIGLYFGQLAFFVGIMCLIAEIISPKLNGTLWRRMYVGSSWKFLVPCTLVMVFLLGTVLQFIYGVDISGAKKINDVVMLIDTSSSMVNTDPQNKRFEAVRSLMDKMALDNRVSIFVFNDNVINVQQMANVTDALKIETEDKLKAYSIASGRTNIKGALEDAMTHIMQNTLQDRAAMVILLSDGGDNYNLENSFADNIKPYKDGDIPIFTVGMEGNDYNLLRKLSQNTGGKYYSLDNAEGLDNVFTRIYMEKDLRLLVGQRNGRTSSSIIYAIMRILFLTIIGAAVGFSVGLLLDNRYIAKGFAIGGIVSGIIAGLILEIGYSFAPQLEYILRFTAAIVLSCLFTLFTMFIVQGENNNLNRGSYRGDVSKINLNGSGFPGKGMGQGKSSF